MVDTSGDIHFSIIERMNQMSWYYHFFCIQAQVKYVYVQYRMSQLILNREIKEFDEIKM